MRLLMVFLASSSGKEIIPENRLTIPENCLHKRLFVVVFKGLANAECRCRKPRLFVTGSSLGPLTKRLSTNWTLLLRRVDHDVRTGSPWGHEPWCAVGRFGR